MSEEMVEGHIKRNRGIFRMILKLIKKPLFNQMFELDGSNITDILRYYLNREFPSSDGTLIKTIIKEM